MNLHYEIEIIQYNILYVNVKYFISNDIHIYIYFIIACETIFTILYSAKNGKMDCPQHYQVQSSVAKRRLYLYV